MEIKNSKFKICKYRGFSLMELMIVIAIIGIMSSVGFSMWQSSRSETYLRNAQREVASAIKTAQSYALQGRVQNGSAPCGYGVRFNGDNYNFFYREGDCLTAPTETGMETYNMNNGISLNGGVTTEVYFKIPFGNMSPATSNDLVISHGTKSKTITINNGVVIEQ